MRLTNEIRDEIIRTVCNDLFSGREKQAEEKEKELGDKIWLHFYGKYTDHITALPESLLAKKDDYVMVNIDGQRRKIDMTVARVTVQGYRAVDGVLATNNKLSKAIDKLDAEKESIKTEKVNVKRAVRGIVYSVTTTKRLKEVWPEGEPYIPYESAGAQLIISTVETNKLIKAAAKKKV